MKFSYHAKTRLLPPPTVISAAVSRVVAPDDGASDTIKPHTSLTPCDPDKKRNIPTKLGCGYADRGDAGLFNFEGVALEICKTRKLISPVIVDLGCGTGIFCAEASHILPEAKYTAIDREDLLSEEARDLCVSGKMRHIICDVNKINPSHLPQRINFATASRLLHWMRYQDAVNLLNLVSSRMLEGDLIYYSVNTLALKDRWEYPYGEDTPIHLRYGKANKKNYTHKMTLFSDLEAEQLVTDLGFKPTRKITSKCGVRHVLASKQVRRDPYSVYSR